MSEFSFLDLIFQTSPGSIAALALAPFVVILRRRQRRAPAPGRGRVLEWLTVVLLVAAGMSAMHGKFEIAPWLGVGAALLVAALAAAGSRSRGLLRVAAIACAAGLYLGGMRLERLIRWWPVLASGELEGMPSTTPGSLLAPLAAGLGMSLLALVVVLVALRPRVTILRVLLLLALLAAGAAWMAPSVRSRAYLALGDHGAARDVLLRQSYLIERGGDVEEINEMRVRLAAILVDLLRRDDPGFRRLSEYLQLKSSFVDEPFTVVWPGVDPAVQAKLERVFRESTDSSLRLWAATNLMRFEGLGADTERALVEVLLSPDAVLAQQVVLALEECWPPGEAATADRAMQAIVELARRTPPGSAPAPGAAGRSRGLTPHEELQLTAIRALGAIGAGSSDARNALTGLATSSEDPVAGTAALLALARWEGEPALLALCSQLLEKDAGNEELPEDVEVGQVLALLELSRLGASAAALLPQVEAVERTRGVCETLNRVVSWEAWNAWLALAPGAPEATLPRLRSMAAELEASRQAGGPQLGSDSTWQYEGARRVLEEIEGR